MSRVVLIIPPSPWLISDTDLPFLGPLYIASYLRKLHGHDVLVCDLSGLKPDDWKIPVGDIYGITGTSPQFTQIRLITKVLKTRDPTCLVVVGGPHATALPEHVLENTEADIAVIGEGERTMAEIADWKDLVRIEGIAYKADVFGGMNGWAKRIHRNDPRGLIEQIDEVPSPALEDLDFYRYAESRTFEYLLGECLEATILTSRGCPYKCAFCAAHKTWQRHVRHHSVDRIIGEIEYLQNRFGVNLVYILDDTFVTDKRRVSKFCHRVKNLGINWHCLNRVDCTTEDLVLEMKDAGCLQMVFGFESGSNTILKRMNKQVKVEDAFRAIDICEKAGMKIRGQMICGFPGETAETVEETAEFMRRSPWVTVFGVHIFQPFPGCDVWENPEFYGWEIDRDTDFADYHTIGKKDFVPNRDEKTIEWFNYLKSVAGDRNIETRIRES